MLQHPHLVDVAESRLANLPNRVGPSAEPGGWNDYTRSFDPRFELEDLSHGALLAVAREFAIQGHILARAMMLAVERRYGREEAIEIGRTLFTGIGWIAAERLSHALATDTGPAPLDRVLPLVHLLLPTDYLGLTITSDAPDRVTIEIDSDAPALHEGDPFSVAGLLELGAIEILEAIARGVDARAEVTARPLKPQRAWTITIPLEGPTHREPPDVRMVRFSTGPSTVFIRRKPLRRATP